ncbi:unannotated protein [freshwater metagenome]|uniref:Unannotated protein n=1 Tax=freshwater metagenome TaxID=449393 RepID=A0A6J7H699_9ZZZZ|nr:hypothetical protein [Actinomycetota bacterium]
MLKIRFVNFWPNFNPYKNLFVCVLEDLLDEKVEIETKINAKVDLEFSSVFYWSSKLEMVNFRLNSRSKNFDYWNYLSKHNSGFQLDNSGKSKYRIWYTGENKRPPSDGYDATISFDPPDEVSKNFYFPYWMYRLDWGYGLEDYEISPTPVSLTKRRNPVARPLTACSFSNQKEPERARVVRAVSGVMPVELFGAAHTNFVGSKLLASSTFGFQIATENSKYPNYVTEKLQESWFARNVPIWTGLNASKEFNLNAFFDVTGHTISEIQEVIRAVTLDALMAKQSEPLLLREPTLDDFKKFLTLFI